MKTYRDSIAHLPELIQECLIMEQPHTSFRSDVPPEFEFLKGGFVDLGFENLDVSISNLNIIKREFSGRGVRIPGTAYKMRATPSLNSVIEPVAPEDETEGIATLPDDWKEALYVVTLDNEFTYVGSKVRPDQLPPDFKR